MLEPVPAKVLLPGSEAIDLRPMSLTRASLLLFLIAGIGVTASLVLVGFGRILFFVFVLLLG